jgi:hypothetical protein
MVFGWKFNYWIIIPMNLLVEASAGASKVLDKQETHGKRGVTFRVDSHLFFLGGSWWIHKIIGFNSDMIDIIWMIWGHLHYSKKQTNRYLLARQSAFLPGLLQQRYITQITTIHVT